MATLVDELRDWPNNPHAQTIVEKLMSGAYAQVPNRFGMSEPSRYPDYLKTLQPWQRSILENEDIRKMQRELDRVISGYGKPTATSVCASRPDRRRVANCPPEEYESTANAIIRSRFDVSDLPSISPSKPNTKPTPMNTKVRKALTDQILEAQDARDTAVAEKAKLEKAHSDMTAKLVQLEKEYDELRQQREEAARAFTTKGTSAETRALVSAWELLTKANGSNSPIVTKTHVFDLTQNTIIKL